MRASGLMLSVLVDSINEKLFDEFADSVLTLDNGPELIEDKEHRLCPERLQGGKQGALFQGEGGHSRQEDAQQ